MTQITHRCKDCKAEAQAWIDRGFTDPKPPSSLRPAPHPGPRCATHHRSFQKAAKKRAHEKRVQDTYGLPPGHYDALYEFQGGRCEICQRATGANRRLSVDHDHKTGEVRGLLCRPCNTMLGHARDNPVMFDRAIYYLRYPPYTEFLAASKEE